MKTNVLKGRKILIVEDDFSSRLYLNKILEKAGAVLINASDGREAVSMVKDDAEIGIILMDIQLPVMDGYMAAEKIRKIKPGMIIIAQTAYGLKSDRERIEHSGFNDLLLKPIIAGRLIERITALIPAPEEQI